MLSRRKIYAGRIKHPDDATEPAALDPLSSIAPLFRARPEIQDVCRFALQWELVHEAEPAGFAQFHIVTNGNCLLERYSGETFKLEAGSILLLGLALKALPIGTAYAVWTGIGAVGTAILGIALFGEPATLARLACIGPIVAGHDSPRPRPGRRPIPTTAARACRCPCPRPTCRRQSSQPPPPTRRTRASRSPCRSRSPARCFTRPTASV